MRTGLQITQPTLLLDTERCRRNIEHMCNKMTQNNIQFRPHFKTHQSRTIGNWFRDYNVEKITVSSLRMAQYFADDGWKDITVAFPVNLLEAGIINTLAERIQLNLLVEDPEVIQQLGQVLSHRVGLFLKIDVGTHRTGLLPADISSIESCIRAMSNSTRFEWKGFLAHAGHTYQVRNQLTLVQTMYKSAIGDLLQLKSQYRGRFPDIQISFGDTPGAAMITDFSGIDEMRPGNFVFYDMMQVQIGSCNSDDVAVAMICPVVATHPERQEYIIYGGGIHFSKDSMIRDDGKASYGDLVPFDGSNWNTQQEDGFIRSLSQEHGVIQMVSGQYKTRPGDLVSVLPVHSCMTAQCMGLYRTVEGGQIDHFATSKYYQG